MEFKLNEYHQGVSDDELLEDIKRVSEEHGDRYLSLKVYDEKENMVKPQFLNILVHGKMYK